MNLHDPTPELADDTRLGSSTSRPAFTLHDREERRTRIARAPAAIAAD